MNRPCCTIGLFFVFASWFFSAIHADAEVVIGPGVQAPFDISTTDHYRLVSGTQVTSSSISRPPADTFSRVSDAVSFRGGGSVQIDGGTYRGGNDTFTGPPDTYFTADAGEALRLWNFTANIYGGTFIGGDAYTTSRLENAHGGIPLYAVYSTVSIYDGTFKAGLRTQPNIPYYPSNYPPVPDAFIIDSTLHLYGGELDYVVLGLSSTLHVYGKNLEQTGSAIYGQFANGRPLNLLVYRDTQAIYLHELVPEPHTTALSIIASMACAARRRTRLRAIYVHLQR